MPEPELWSRLYQTDDSPENRQKYLNTVKLYTKGSDGYEGPAQEEVEIDKSARLAADAFLGDMQNVDPAFTMEKFVNLIKQTAYLETHGGAYGVYQGSTPNNILTEAKKGSPGRGWWQVEAATARDLMDGSNKKLLLGKNAKELIVKAGFNLEALKSMKDDELGEAIAHSPLLGAMFVADKYATAYQEYKLKQKNR